MNMTTENVAMFLSMPEVIYTDYEENKDNLVYYVVHFGGAGTDFTTGSPVSDNSSPIKICTKGLSCVFGTDPPLPYVAGMHLKVEALADPDWNSSLNGIAFYPQGDIDWTFDYSQRVNQFALTPDLESLHQITMQTSGAGWLFSWNKLLRRGKTWDRKTRKALTNDFQYGRCGYSDGSLGGIYDPAGAPKWLP